MRLTWITLSCPDRLYLTAKGKRKVDFPFKGSFSSLGETTGPSYTPTNRLKVLAAWHALWLPPPFNTESPRRRQETWVCVCVCGWAERNFSRRQEKREINIVRCCTVRTFVQYLHIFYIPQSQCGGNTQHYLQLSLARAPSHREANARN